jgi:hypothetical protein
MSKTDPVHLLGIIMDTTWAYHENATDEEMRQLQSLSHAHLCRDGTVIVDREDLKESNLEYAPQMLLDSPEALLFHVKGTEKKARFS